MVQTLKQWSLFSLMGGLLSACSVTDPRFLIANAPALFFDGTIHRDVAYGKGARNQLDIYVPKNIVPHAPVVIFYHGGRWKIGNKNQYTFMGLALAKQGFVAVVPNYALYPDVKFPAFMKDVALAANWAAKNIETYGGSAQNLFVMGHSSGAHLGGLLAANPEYMNSVGENYPSIAGFIGLAGPYAFKPAEPDLQDMFGPPENYDAMRTPTYIDGTEPPFLLLHGADDTTVVVENQEHVVEAIQAKNPDKNAVQSKVYEGIGHIGIIAAYTWLLGYKAPIQRDVANFVNRVSKVQP